MVDALRDLAGHYRAMRTDVRPVPEQVALLYQHSIRERERSLLDAAAATVAVNEAFLSDQIDMSDITPQMKEAFELAYPHVSLSSLIDRSPEEVEGFLPAWKGKLFEVLVRDRLNAGEWVGDIHLEAGQSAALASSATQPGWDLRIFEADGSVAEELQLKATDSIGYVKSAIERYPGIEVLTTDEALAGGHSAIDGVLASGMSDHQLEEAVTAPVEDLLDGTFGELAETVLPGLPFVLIAVGEGRHILAGRKSFEAAMKDGLFRTTKTATAIGVGALVVWMDGGLLSLPATLLTRLGFDRVKVSRSIEERLSRRIQELQSIRSRLVVS